MTDFQIIAYAGAVTGDPAVAIAASRGLALGVLDLTYARDVGSSAEAVARLTEHGRGEMGVKLDTTNRPLLGAVLDCLPGAVTTVVLVPGDSDELPRRVTALRRRGVRVLLEVVSMDEADDGQALGVDGLIAKGHEAAGRVGSETAFILLQRLRGRTALPVWAHGGVGLHTAAGCAAVGAAGVVLDSQLLLTREARMPAAVRATLERMDGSETVHVRGPGDEGLRLLHHVSSPVVATLEAVAGRLTTDSGDASPGSLSTWRVAARNAVGMDQSEPGALLVGQDAAMARPLACGFTTVGGIVAGIRDAVAEHIRAARRVLPLGEGAPLARSHGTRYPIVQGPMTRVSDRAAFAGQVADAGGLPFLALALMRRDEVAPLLEETEGTMAGRPWGVGILGFVPANLREEQLGVIQEHPPPFALIAGGRPDQAQSLESAGISTYLHVPSPGLLEMFVDSGSRRFVFEGRECGGHVGPRSSFVLWEQMTQILLDHLSPAELRECHVLFAGGIHDSSSAAMVAATAAELADRGGRVGVLLGTAYLFTEEVVASGAIVPGFQHEAVRCRRTVLLESGSGHATRCADTEYASAFERERRRLLSEGRPAHEVRALLEDLNLGRLRLASKGVNRHPGYGREPGVPKLRPVSQEEQESNGLYMIGQLAALRDSVVTMEGLHRDVSIGSMRRLEELGDSSPLPASARDERPCDVAIVGMACHLPKAGDLSTYWRNIVVGVDAVTEVPEDRWDWRRYFDEDAQAHDRVYSRWGGFLDDLPFDPTRWGIPPSTLRSTEPLQILALEVARRALEDAGYASRPFRRDRTSVILGVGGGIADVGQQYVFRSQLPTFFDDAPPDVLERLPEWTEDSFAGILLNVTAGRISNRLDFGGVNYTVDAACASSLAAVYAGASELEAGTSDMVLVGGADTVQNPFAYLCFSKTHALSPTGRCRPFDASADGIAISEGIAIVTLKRLADAERDGDRIYAVLKGVAGSSDGRARGLTAPSPAGQARALERAYAKAGFLPSTVGLIEAHGTGTVAGDQAELTTLKDIFEASGADTQSCAVGSVKSMIGHTKCAAGVAGLIKAALALHHRVLPPTLHVDAPVAAFKGSPFYPSTSCRPWVGAGPDRPRRAGVSAFGFGGTNFHAVLEEYADDYLRPLGVPVAAEWPTEVFVWSGESCADLADQLATLRAALGATACPSLRDLAAALWRAAAPDAPGRACVVASSPEDLGRKLARLEDQLRDPQSAPGEYGADVWHVPAPLGRDGRLAFLFPGQGSHYPDMGRELAVHFDEVRRALETADRVLADRLERPLSSYILPAPSFTPEETRTRAEALRRTDVAQPALGAVESGFHDLLQALGLRPDVVAGHSYGEYVALRAAGAISEEELFDLSHARGRAIVDAGGPDLGTMAAVNGSAEQVAAAIGVCEGVWIANLNAPLQTVVSGTRPAVEAAAKRLEREGLSTQILPVACGFHSPLVAPATDQLAGRLSQVRFASPKTEVFSNTTASPYPDGPRAIAELLARHTVSPVRFTDEIEAMYEAGARVFVEVGPRSVLTGLVRQILHGRPYVAVAPDEPPGLRGLQRALAALWAHGLPLRLERLFEGRVSDECELTELLHKRREMVLPSTTWLVNGGSVRPLGETAAGPPSSEDGRATPTSAREQAADAASDVDAPVAAGPPGSLVSTSAATPAGEAATGAPRPPPPDVASVRAVSPSPDATGPGPVVGSVTAGLPMADADAAVVGFQRLMSQFLDTQRAVMLAYLGGADRSVAAAPRVPVGPAAGALANAVPSPAVIVSTLGAGGPPAAFGDISLEPREVRSPVPDESPDGTAAPTDSDEVGRRLVELVSERTGYPADILDRDLEIESELGIDSIKRVEILGAVQRAYPSPLWRSVPRAMEKLLAMRTLRGIADAVVELLSTGGTQRDGPSGPPHRAQGAGPVAGAEAQRTAAPGDAPREVRRYVMRAFDAPLPPEAATPTFGGVLLLTDDEQGVARRLADRLGALGCEAVVVQMSDGGPSADGEGYAADLGDDQAAAHLVDAVRRRHGPLGGLVHLLPLKPGPADGDAASWRARVTRDVKSLYHLARASGPDFKRPDTAAPAVLLGVTAMGGTFGFEHPLPDGMPSSHGGVAGMVKCLALEWSGTRGKVVDVEPGADPATVADRLLSELRAEDALVEVGYRGDRRLALRAARAPIGGPLAGAILDRRSVVLVTGGARGITAVVARHLAERYQPTLVLVGRSPLPGDREPPDTAGITNEHDLKAVLAERLRLGGEVVTPVRVAAACRQLLAEREIASNLDVMRRAGAAVEYRQVDVRDEQALSSLLDEVHTTHGRLDGVIHGAGVIEDQLVERKKPDSFDRVFDTKAAATRVLVHHPVAETLGFFVLFSSTAGRFGNPGQADYAAANEVASKLVSAFARRSRGRVVVAHWGPWRAGMAGPEVQRRFEALGVRLVEPGEGASALDRELRAEAPECPEVVFGQGPWDAREAPRATTRGAHERTAASPPPAPATAAARSPARAAPLWNGQPLVVSDDGHRAGVVHVEAAAHRYLADHLLDDRPVMPLAMAVELVAETVERAWPDHVVAEIADLRVLGGIIVGQGGVDLMVECSPLGDFAGDEFDVEVRILDAGGGRRPRYRAMARMARRLPDPPPYRAPGGVEIEPFPLGMEDAYRRWLFHGPTLQCVVAVHGISDRGMTATVRPSQPYETVGPHAHGDWVIDPVVVDSAPQLAILWARARRNVTALPSGFSRYRRYGRLAGGPLACAFEVRPASECALLVADVAFLGDDGSLLGRIEGLECTCDAALNRLGGGATFETAEGRA